MESDPQLSENEHNNITRRLKKRKEGLPDTNIGKKHKIHTPDDQDEKYLNSTQPSNLANETVTIII